MIDSALSFLKDELETYLYSHGMDSTMVQVKLSSLVDDSGKYAIGRGTVAIYLFNIEEERVMKSHALEYVYINGQHVIRQPEIKLNLHILIAAYMQGYDDSLKVISSVLTFFQGRPTFTSDSHPALDERIARLVPELQSLNYEQLNQIWAFIGGKQLPSVAYKIRLVALQDEVQAGVQPPVTVIRTETGNR